MSVALIADKLRASLLQVAIQGKLTKQLPEDGDARDLLKEIEAEKARLIEEKVIKKEKPLPPITEEEIPFEIPENWAWVRLGDIGSTNIGLTYNKNDVSDHGTIILRSGNIQNNKIDLLDILKVKSNIPENKQCYSGDLLICARNGSRRLVGKSALIKENGMSFGAFMALFRSVCNPFVHYFLQSPFYRENLDGVSTTTINQITQENLKQQIIPLPPLSEQHRIVEAIEIALAKLDKLKADETKLYDIQKAFPNKLRVSLLQSAIQGQLTEQLPEDGDARDLLKEIEAEKARLIAEKIIKKEKPLPPITDEEIPFEIPENWAWVRLGDLCAKVGAGSTPSGGKAVYLDDGVKFIRSQNVHNDGLYLDNVAFIAEKTHFSKKGSTVYPKDLLLNITGGSIGRCCVVPDDFDTANVNQHVLILRLFDEKIRFYLHQVIISPFIFKLIMDLQVGGTKEGLSATSAKNLLIPFPPLAEQQRIVEKLDEILGKVDGLKKIAE